MVPHLSLVVIRTADLTRARCFYESLGLTFREEPHGSGTLHLSLGVAGTVSRVTTFWRVSSRQVSI
jgi:catechol 2,3-dioxygenase-like lactoylglutathione lyase family enzyme